VARLAHAQQIQVGSVEDKNLGIDGLHHVPALFLMFRFHGGKFAAKWVNLSSFSPKLPTRRSHEPEL
jgi:hypothetical protein